MSRILIAEDERATGHLLRKTLEDAGHGVSLVTDGESALKALRAEPFDLMLLDI